MNACHLWSKEVGIKSVYKPWPIRLACLATVSVA